MDDQGYKGLLARFRSQRNEKGQRAAEQMRSPHSQNVPLNLRGLPQGGNGDPYRSYGRDPRGSAGSSLLSSSNASPFATDSRLSISAGLLLQRRAAKHSASTERLRLMHRKNKELTLCDSS